MDKVKAWWGSVKQKASSMERRDKKKYLILGGMILLFIIVVVSDRVAHSAEMPDYPFVALECSIHGTFENPVMVISDGKAVASGPAKTLHQHAGAMALLESVLSEEHKAYVDPLCKGTVI